MPLKDRSSPVGVAYHTITVLTVITFHFRGVPLSVFVLVRRGISNEESRQDGPLTPNKPTALPPGGNSRRQLGRLHTARTCLRNIFRFKLYHSRSTSVIGKAGWAKEETGIGFVQGL